MQKFFVAFIKQFFFVCAHNLIFLKWEGEVKIKIEEYIQKSCKN